MSRRHRLPQQSLVCSTSNRAPTHELGLIALDLLIQLDPLDLANPARVILPIIREIERNDGLHQPMQGDGRRPYERRQRHQLRGNAVEGLRRVWLAQASQCRENLNRLLCPRWSGSGSPGGRGTRLHEMVDDHCTVLVEPQRLAPKLIALDRAVANWHRKSLARAS